ncbi:uncharacterized protein ATNIH1004_006523 [Aspergillus tanneri]|uniref:Nucleoside phosphorylase domain-containing protein n=1 Tax=Aspergillus tanneri TaxID=1220188 RepID=A0A5M9MLE0_9EURO|nr:uncharacterized protein ATNIH1004_006523 [Aspergillus tanneri]KAA8647821.1 hypothetical protein ATNIH1004_006523 [Aspergillus tanneri]
MFNHRSSVLIEIACSSRSSKAVFVVARFSGFVFTDHAVVNDDANPHISRSQLEGWDFNNLAAERDPIYPRVTNLSVSGRSWVDFTRSIHVITLFGRGFGEIIRPVNSCSHWSRLPPGQSYIAICHADLQETMKAGGGNPYSTPVKLTDTLIWRIPEEFSWLFQVLLSLSTHCELSLKSFNYDKKSCGALIFGYNSIHGWYWAEIVEPSREPPEPQMSIFSKRKSSSPSEDSGIGKSLDSFTFLDGERVMGPSANFNANEEYFEPPRELPVTHTSCPERMSPCFIPGDYTVAIICALHKELMAVRILFDFTHENVSVPAADPNSYAFGLMGKLDIVATCLPDGEYGTSPAADVASNMKRSFCTIKFCLLVGIGGGVLSAQNDIRLGDVVSKPVGTSVGTIYTI